MASRGVPRARRQSTAFRANVVDDKCMTNPDRCSKSCQGTIGAALQSSWDGAQTRRDQMATVDTHADATGQPAPDGVPRGNRPPCRAERGAPELAFTRLWRTLLISRWQRNRACGEKGRTPCPWTSAPAPLLARARFFLPWSCSCTSGGPSIDIVVRPVLPCGGLQAGHFSTSRCSTRNARPMGAVIEGGARTMQRSRVFRLWPRLDAFGSTREIRV